MAEEIKVEVKAEVQEPAAEVKAENAGRKPKKDFKKDGRRRDDRRKDENDKVLVSLRRVTKVVKGGRTFRFSAMVVVGDKKGKIGIAIGKAKEVPMAIEKAGNIARRHMQSYQITNGTIEHEVIGKYGKSTITLLPAKPGTGIIAGGSARAVLELAGVTDIVTKIHGSTNKINVVKATLDGLSKIQTKAQIAERRNKSVEEV
ncbi:MAG: 30S ribosomal protein S5 [Clostridia bacterium]|nr:30S ribosomal protein S5 [Clostridia bacterium]MBR2053125.1 30S ribosomal protein S5 [Clostridia bacterium]MBR2220876.1 30S ribosomal protein S5 [Clostridia bacterium]MBR2433482.1 30S ribosomal protein S5 [Clostridia bacterium]